jgi:hypothetical protein
VHGVCNPIGFRKLYWINAMQPIKLLHKLFKKELPSIHKIRLKNLLDSSEAAT